MKKEQVPVPENRKEPEPVWNRLPFETDWPRAEELWKWSREYRLKEQKDKKVPLWGSWWSGL